VNLKVVALAACAFFSGIVAASGHPHVLVTSRSEIVLDGRRVAAVRHVWTFDEAFSAFAIQGLDSDGDGKLTAEELKPLAQVNVESLQEYGFFTFLTVAGAEVDKVPFGDPADYWLDWDGRQLTLHFTLPLVSDVDAGAGPIRFDVYDPEYFVAFSMDQEKPAALAGGAETCQLSVMRAKELGAEAQARLAQIPAEIRDLPENLYAMTSGLANAILVHCR